jgi:DNA-binding transcriptional LysR family regulator
MNLKHLHYFHEVAREGSLTGGARAEPRRLTLRLGVTDSVPKLLTARVLAPLLERHRDRIELDCIEGAVTGLIGRLAAHELDAVLAQPPAADALKTPKDCPR